MPDINTVEDLQATPAKVRRDITLEVALEQLRAGEFAVIGQGAVWHRGPCGHLFELTARGRARYSAGVSNLNLVTVHPEVVCPQCGAEWVVVGGRTITDPRFRGMLRRRAEW